MFVVCKLIWIGLCYQVLGQRLRTPDAAQGSRLRIQAWGSGLRDQSSRLTAQSKAARWAAGKAGRAGRAGRACRVAQPPVTPVGVAQPLCRHRLPHSDLGQFDLQLLVDIVGTTATFSAPGRAPLQLNVVRRGKSTPRSCHVRFDICMVAKLLPQCEFSFGPTPHLGLWRYVCR